ncbi:relaxase/mobilization nuclease domain-containing protein [Novosphingobium sp. KN65.2]|uniref:relaxase/mobilization nuclease domain-containing protein n=1 Tax=Novosphingobium sp. KN65.2 TaxID=1478134 RepID=UPI0005E47FF1|nr:relaxase/mobilization nuclease domain-containing protein [Novosphingobium sp. KN65.2]CDO38856.1 conserved hypothetical protein [Novosphingobium sp. KN65.2]
MILKASQRGGAKNLGLHLLKTEENEHVEIHEISGFVADDLMGAMKEAHALSKGTKCRQPLFSVSLNPPAHESVRVEVFEQACDRIAERMGLQGQPRIIVFHEKEGRRHAHAVWSRIDAETMTARPLPFFKAKLREISKELYIENGWKMPEGFRDSKLRDARNFTLDEWQQAKRAGIDVKQVRQTVQECWAATNNGAAFAKTLETRGLFLARGDRRGHVVVSMHGETFSIARMVGKKGREVAAKLGQPDELRSVPDTIRHIGETVMPLVSRHISDAKRMASDALKPLNEKKRAMAAQHRSERQRLDRMQRERQDAERKSRSDRLRKGVSGLWDRLTGRHGRTQKQNEMEAFFGLQRDRAQRHDLVSAQLKERQTLQRQIVQVRSGHADQLLGLYRDAARYRHMARDGQKPEERPAGSAADRPAAERPSSSRPTGRDSGPAPRGPREPGMGR